MLDYSIENGTLSIYFENASNETLFALFRVILSFQNDGMYCAEIDGLEGTIDDFVETCSSKEYKIYQNGKWHLWIRYLPTLFLVTKEWEDIHHFIDFIGSFNEGSMALYYLDTCHDLLQNNKDAERVREQIWRHTYVKLKIFQDGDGIEVIAGPRGYSSEKILRWLIETNK